MKKLLVLALVFGLAAGMVFAEVNFGGGLNAGVTFKVQDVKDWDEDYGVYANTWHDDADNFRHQLKASYSQDYFGLEGGIKTRINNSTDWSFEAYDVSAWVKPLQNNLLQINLGQTGGDWGSPAAMDTGTGDAAMRLNFRPGVDGLSFGVTFGNRNWGDPTGTLSKIDNPHYVFTGSYAAAEPDAPAKEDLAAWQDNRRDVVDFFRETGFGVRYDISLFTVAAGFRLKTDVLNDENMAYLGLKLKSELFGLPGLNVDAAVRADRLTAFSAGNFYRLYYKGETYKDLDNQFGGEKDKEHTVGKDDDGSDNTDTYKWVERYNRGGRIYAEARVTYENGPFYVNPRFDICMYPTAKGYNNKGEESAIPLGWKFQVEPSYKILPGTDRLQAWVYFGIDNHWEDASAIKTLYYEISPLLQYKVFQVGNAELIARAGARRGG